VVIIALAYGYFRLFTGQARGRRSVCARSRAVAAVRRPSLVVFVVLSGGRYQCVVTSRVV